MDQKITPFLWFDGDAEEAVDLYLSVFKDSEILHVSRNGEGGPVFVIRFRLFGMEFMALNGGPQFKFNESVSFMIDCESQEEVDWYWDKLIAGGGEESMCGWLKDRFGLSWQVTPKALIPLISDPDPEKAARTMKAMMGMRKLDVAELQRAHDGV